MKICKYCQAEMAENGNFCPVCGKNNSEEAVEETVVMEETAAPAEDVIAQAEAAVECKEEKKATPGKIAVAVVAVVVLVALLIGLIGGGMTGNKVDDATVPSDEATAAPSEETVPATVPADGNPDDETCKGTYTVTDEEVIAAMDTVVATAGDIELTNAELQIYYWLEVQSFLQQYGSYAAYFGLDYTQPLDTQVCALAEGVTWQQFFLKNALGTWQNYSSIAAEAELADFRLEAEIQSYLDNLEVSMEEDALAKGFANSKDLMVYNVGSGAEIEDYVNYSTTYYNGFEYYMDLCEGFDTSDAALEAYYQENEAEFTENQITREDKYVDVRHILIMPETDITGEDGSASSSDAAWAQAEMQALDILNLYEAGEKTEDSFAALANEYTADGNDTNYDGIPDGGLYTDVYKGQMVPEFETWCFDEARVSGDTGLVKTTYGWHVMYFVTSRPVWKSFAEEQLTMKLANELIAEITAKYPLTVDYSAIKLGYVNMAG